MLHVCHFCLPSPSRTSLGLSLLLLVLSSLPAHAQVSSTFDADADGWEAATYPVRGPYDAPVATPPLTYRADGGNPGGYIEIEDPDNDVVFWRAPAAFIGDQGGMYGGMLSFDLLNSAAIDYTDDFDVVLRGAGLTLLIELEPPLQSTWTTYAVGLQEDFAAMTAWTKEDQNGDPPTQAEFQSVLLALDDILIRAEYSNAVAGEFMGLDNPTLTLGTTATENGAPGSVGLVLAGLYPHPLRDVGTLSIAADHPQAGRVELFDLLGRRVALVFEGVLAAGETVLPLHVGSLPAGLYVVRVQGRDAVVSRQLIVGG